MAYKFQLGAARLSGSLTQEGDINGEGNIAIADSATIGCASDADLITLADTAVTFASNADVNIAKAGGLQIGGSAVTSTAAEINLLDAITRGSIIYGDASGASARLAVGSANTVLATDGTDIGYSQIDNAMIDNSAAIAFSKLASLSDGNILVGNGSNVATSVAMSGDIAIDNAGATTIQANAVEGTMLNANVVDDSSIEISSNALQVKASGVTNAMLANSDVTIGSTAVALGATQTSFSGLTGLDFTAASAAIASSIGANNLTLGGSTSTVIVAGNLTVQGTTTTVDSTTINVSSSFTFEGVADDFETTLGIVDPAADRTVLLPNNSGVLAIFDPSLSDSELATALTAAPSELNLLDAGAGSSVALASGDGLIIFDATDSNNGKKVLMSDVSTFVGDNIAVNVQNVAAAGTLQVGVNYFSDMGSDGEDAVTLPASPSVGQSVKVKAPSDCSSARYITINRAGSQTIDGETSIRLESPFAAVELVYVASDLWRVF